MQYFVVINCESTLYNQENVYELKKEIYKNKGLPVKSYYLVRNGSILEDNDKLNNLDNIYLSIKAHYKLGIIL